MVGDQPWWLLQDVAKVLDYRDASDAKRRLRSHTVTTHQVCTKGGNRLVNIVNEPGLYRLIMRSNKPEAERFQDWIFEDVLPTLRKTGSYNMPGQQTPKTFAEALELAAKQARELELTKPRAELLSLFEKEREGMSIGDVGALFGYRPFQFHEMCRSWGATVHDRSGRVRGSQFWLDQGWLRSRRNGDHGTPAVTPEGLVQFEKKLGRQVVGSSRPELEA